MKKHSLNRYRFDYSWILVILVIFLVSLYSYRNLWSQVVTRDRSNQLTIQGESPVYEFVAETVKDNILAHKNPFSQTDSVLFPFGWRFAIDDMMPIVGFYFLLLRPFLSIHQSFMFTILLGVIVSGMTMYYLLRLLKIDKIPALLTALVFCFSPFVTLRIGAHPSYTTFYLFTFPAISFIKLINEKILVRKYLFSALLAVSMSLVFLTNLYFSVMMFLMISILSFFYFIFYPRDFLAFILKNIKYIFLSVFLFILILSPWLYEVFKVINLGKRDLATDWNDILLYSADLTNLFIPFGSNPVYRTLLAFLSSRHLYISSIFENFIYPGLIIIIATVFYWYKSERFPKFLKSIFYTGIVFLLFTFGPYLQIFGKNLWIPMPYIIIPYIPYLQMARSPGRFIVPFIFLSAIITGFVIQYVMKRVKKKWLRYVILTAIFILFFFDQVNVVGKPTVTILPIKIHQYLSDQNTGPILEIPFLMRDSIKNLGYANVIWSPYGSLLHKQRIFGVYAGRVSNDVFDHYLKNPLIGPLGNIVDGRTTDWESMTKKVDRNDFINAFDFYQIEYVLNKDDEKYSPSIAQLLNEVSFKKIMVDGAYSLWYRQTKPIIVSEATFDSNLNDFILADGWGNREPNDKSRWAMSHISNLFLSLDESKKSDIIIEAEAIVKSQTVKIYINDQYAGKMIFETGKYSKRSLPINETLRPGINKITLRFENIHNLSKIIPGSKDNRALALHVKYIGIK